MAESIKLQGFRALADTLHRLPEAMRKRIVVRAVRAAAKPVEADAKRRAPELKKPDKRRKRGTLKGAIRTRAMMDRSLDGAAVKVGVKPLSRKAIRDFKQRTGKDSNENPDDPFYAHMVEKGTSKMQAQPFVRPALEAKRFVAIEEMRASIKKDIEREGESIARANKGKG
jgi:HK97 gp10 family phage protein